ncbi:MAG: Porin B [Chlamydiia bacterium]|nr:Porin B [Chlamydiia bacterium]MCH9616045.1 Porin B [Chlamydiia bacterium]MCH9629068.1 Porin B [Chlamydiia bacterium]
MIFRILIGTFCILPLLAADHWFSGTNVERHRALREYLEKNGKEGMPPPPHPNYVTGSWGGQRYILAKKGITFTSTYATDFLGNPVGGKAKGFTYTGSWGADMTLDFGKLKGWEGWDFYTSICWRRGKSLSGDKIGNWFPVQQVFGTQTFQLVDLCIRKQTENGLVRWDLGRLCAGDYFFQSDLYYSFVNNGFCGNPISIFFNTALSVYPHAGWGTYLKANPSKQFGTKWGIFFANSNIDKSKYHGFDFSYNETQKFIFISEWSFYVSPDKNSMGYPGSYRAGAYYTNGLFNQNFPYTTKSNNQGFYFLFDQMVYRFTGAKKNEGIHPFVTLLFAPDGNNMFPFFSSSGIVISGFSQRRPRDVIAMGGAYGQMSKKLDKQNQLRGIPHKGTELDLELNYKIVFNDFFFFQPTAQYIIRPGGESSVPNALALGAQAQLTF